MLDKYISSQPKRVLTHYRFSKVFALINRTLRTRRNAISKIQKLYVSYGLIEDGCSLCKGNDFILLSEGDRYGFDLKKQFCNSCGLIQTYPKLSPEFHEEFYSYHYRPLYLKNKKVDYKSVIQEQVDKGNKYIEFFLKNGLENELKDLNLLEIGCSSGGTLKTIQPFVNSAFGCDLDIEAIKFAQSEYGLNVEVAMLPSKVPDAKKLFLISHVLEHVFNPLDTLIEVRKLMEKGDYLFIAVPGLNMVAKGDYKYDLRRYFHIAHTTDFTGTTLCNVAKKAGFEVLNYDEEINALFIAGEECMYKKSEQDSIQNIKNIEAHYQGKFPHM